MNHLNTTNFLNKQQVSKSVALGLVKLLVKRFKLTIKSYLQPFEEVCKCDHLLAIISQNPLITTMFPAITVFLYLVVILDCSI